ncbi:hypothetical protein LCGC14_2146810 [marine sediment metagenome]|uniref:Fibronectin type-III domain-containing protein n=1 Tax=marine sediment metagenome TaxID=412755 RepID=A0A0F9DX03_9ZZZZ
MADFGFSTKGGEAAIAPGDGVVGATYFGVQASTKSPIYPITFHVYVKNETGSAYNMKAAIYDSEFEASSSADFVITSNEVEVPIGQDGWVELTFPSSPYVSMAVGVNPDYFTLLPWQDHPGGGDITYYRANGNANQSKAKSATYGAWPDPITGLSTTAKKYSIYFVYYWAPAVTTDAASGITDVAATLNATLDDDGSDPAGCDCYFEWGITTDYGTTTTTQSGKVTNDTFLQALTTLLPNTLYHYRAVAENAAATTYGDDVTFTTQSIWEGGETKASGFVSSIRRHFSADANKTEGGTYTVEIGIGGYGRAMVGFSGPDADDHGRDPAPDFYGDINRAIIGSIMAATTGIDVFGEIRRQQEVVAGIMGAVTSSY